MTNDALPITNTPHRRAGCRELLEHASEYLESDLTPEEKERLTRHLEECHNCEGFVSTLKDTIAKLHTLPPHTLPPEFKQKLLQACEEQSSRQ